MFWFDDDEEDMDVMDFPGIFLVLVLSFYPWINLLS